MYTLVRSLTDRYVFAQQLVTFAVAFGIAAMFFAFHSFALETLAFLGTWFVLDAGVTVAARALKPAKQQ